MRIKPHSDMKPKPPQHDWPHAWWGDSDVQCKRCHRKLSSVDRTNVDCVSDDHIEKAEIAGRAFARVRGAR